MVDVVNGFKGEYAYLSNFWENPVEISIGSGKTMTFPTAEHAFQATKAKAMISTSPADRLAYLLRVQKQPTPSKAKYEGRSVKIDVASWDKQKNMRMREVVFSKFHDTMLCSQLLSTGAYMLVEANDWGDKYWGRVDGKGLNVLGCILMEVRGYWWFGGATETLTYLPPEIQTNIMMGW